MGSVLKSTTLTAWSSEPEFHSPMVWLIFYAQKVSRLLGRAKPPPTRIQQSIFQRIYGQRRCADREVQVVESKDQCLEKSKNLRRPMF